MYFLSAEKVFGIPLAWRQRDGMRCTVTQFPRQPVAMATGAAETFVASEEVGGGEDGKGTGTIHPRLVASDRGCVGSLSASSLFCFFFYFKSSIYFFIRLTLFM